MTIINNNENNNENNDKKRTGSTIFTTDMGTGKQGNISSVNGSSEENDRVNVSESNKAHSAGAPGSAGIVGSKRWLKAHTDQTGNITSSSEHSINS